MAAALLRPHAALAGKKGKSQIMKPSACLLRLSPLALMFLAGCGAVHFPGEFDDADITNVNQIRNNANLTGQEKRDQLRGLGIDEVTINGLLRTERTANQFGGTENTAFDKVTGDLLLSMTPDEIQLYGDLTNATVFTDAQAQELSELFVDQLIASVDQLETWLTENDIDSANGLTDENVQAVFVDTDPDTLIPDLP